MIARLELRKSTLGGFVGAGRMAELGEDANLEQERIRTRNWELLRQRADETGLFSLSLSIWLAPKISTPVPARTCRPA